MKYNNIEFFNVSDYRVSENIPGIILQRYPLNVQSKMGYLDKREGSIKSKTLGGCEIRFISDVEDFELSLYPIDNDVTIRVFQGDFQNASYRLNKNQVNTISIKKHKRFLDLDVDKIKYKRRYQSTLWRIVFEYGANVSFVSLNTFEVPYSLPKKDDVASKTYLAYGSSITQGAGASSILNCYISLFGDLTNADILNKGLSGSCFLEKEVIDYLLSVECDEFIFEVGCNARGVMDEDEFSKRLEYLISSAIKTDKRIIVINMLEFFKNQYKCFSNIPYDNKNTTFTEITKRIIEKYKNDKLTLISSNELLTNLSTMSYDMLHPSDYGHLNIALELKKITK